MVRNSKGKEFGPYSREQVLDFYEQKKLEATTNLRLVDGTGVATVQDLIQQEESAENKTSVVRLDMLKKMRERIEKEKELDKERKEQERVKEEFKKELESEKFEEFKFGRENQAEEELDYEAIDEELANRNIDRTVIRRPVMEADIEHTIVLSANRPPLEGDGTGSNAATGNASNAEGSNTTNTIEEEKLEEDLETDDATRALTIANIDAGIRLEAKNSERLAQEEIHRYEKELRDAEKKVQEEEEEEEEEVVQTTRKKIGPIFVVLFIAVSYMFMFDDEDVKKLEPPKYLNITEILYQEVANETKSMQYYEKGVELYNKGTYKSKLYAINSLKMAVSFDSQNKQAVDLLIFLYADLLENTKDMQDAKKKVFSLIRQNRSRINKSKFLVAGTTKFFNKIGNPQAAYNTVWNYIQLYYREKLDAEENGVEFNRKQWPIVWAMYLEAQVAMDMLESEEIKKNYNSLSKIPKKAFPLYQSLLVYLQAANRDKEYFELLQEARKKYPGSVYFLMLYTDFLFKHGDLHTAKTDKEGKKQFDSYLKALEEMTFLNFEGSPYYFARLLEHKAMARGIIGKQREAIAYIKKSLKVLENKELRSKLSKFELMEKDGRGTEIILNTIVNESRLLEAIEESQDALRAKNYEKAILGAIKATSILPNDNRARLNLARIQISRGYFELALKTLEEIATDNPLSVEIQVELIRGYIKAKKIKEAELHVSKLLKTDKLEFSRTWYYPSLVGRIYHVKESWGMAITKLLESVRDNPLNAEDLFLLSKIYLKYRQYSKCKYFLNQAMELDPNNIDYHILYANTIYELQDANTAIGYLKRRLEDYPNHARIMGAIANYYYLAGYNKEFAMYQEKIKKVEKQDKFIYEFLIKASITEEKWAEVIEYAKLLIIIDPSDLEAYMLLGENLYKRGRFVESLNVLDQVEERLSTYKKLHYLKAKVFIAQRQYEEAIQEAEKEIKANPQESYGYTVKGLGFIKLEKYPDAINALKIAVSRNGKDIEALMALADVRYQQDKYDEARELYFRVKKDDPNNAMLHRQLGHIYRKIGQPAIAIENYKVYLNQNPTAKDRSQIEGIIQAIK